MNEDRAYYVRRVAEERAAAIRAEHPNARAAHLEMARLYDERLSAMADGAGPASIRLVGAA
jgi:hypothetical protein